MTRTSNVGTNTMAAARRDSDRTIPAVAIATAPRPASARADRALGRASRAIVQSSKAQTANRMAATVKERRRVNTGTNVSSVSARANVFHVSSTERWSRNAAATAARQQHWQNARNAPYQATPGTSSYAPASTTAGIAPMKTRCGSGEPV